MNRTGSERQSSPESPPAEATAGLYPIRTVAEMTGVNPVTLRAWERRYRLVVPTRTAKGHRLYTDGDVAVIRRVLGLLERGVPVSRVARLVDEASSAASSTAAFADDDSWSRYLRRSCDAVARFDAPALDAIYNDAHSLYPLTLVSARLTIPILERLGREWRDEPAGVAREHFFTTFLRNKLGAHFNFLNQHRDGQRLVAACPAGEHHDLGLLLFALAAVTRGYRVILLGGNTPARQVAAAATASDSDAVVLSVSSTTGVAGLRRAVSALVSAGSTPVIVGGAAATRHADTLAAIGATPVGTDPEAALQTIARVLSRA